MAQWLPAGGSSSDLHTAAFAHRSICMLLPTNAQRCHCGLPLASASGRRRRRCPPLPALPRSPAHPTLAGIRVEALALRRLPSRARRARCPRTQQQELCALLHLLHTGAKRGGCSKGASSGRLSALPLTLRRLAPECQHAVCQGCPAAALESFRDPPSHVSYRNKHCLATIGIKAAAYC